MFNKKVNQAPSAVRSIVFGSAFFLTVLLAAPAFGAEPVLKLDDNCEPDSWITDIRVSQMSASEKRSFWSGQLLAVEASYARYLEFHKSIDSIQQQGIVDAELNRQKCYIDNMRYKINAPCYLPEVDASLAKTWTKIDVTRNKDIEKKRKWAYRCMEKAARLSR